MSRQSRQFANNVKPAESAQPIATVPDAENEEEIEESPLELIEEASRMEERFVQRKVVNWNSQRVATSGESNATIRYLR